MYFAMHVVDIHIYRLYIRYDVTSALFLIVSFAFSPLRPSSTLEILIPHMPPPPLTPLLAHPLAQAPMALLLLLLLLLLFQRPHLLPLHVLKFRILQEHARWSRRLFRYHLSKISLPSYMCYIPHSSLFARSAFYLSIFQRFHYRHIRVLLLLAANSLL